jgi:hypothetical protein
MENRHSYCFSLQPNSENKKLAIISAAVMLMWAKRIAKLLQLHAVQHIFKLILDAFQQFFPPFALSAATFPTANHRTRF